MSFTRPSKKIQEFLNTNISLPAFHLTEKSKPLLNQLYKHAQNALLIEPNYTIIETKIQPNADFPKSSNYNYLSNNIKRELNELNKHVIETKMTVGLRIYTFFFVFPHDSKNIALLSEYMKKIHTWLYIASKYAEPRCSNTVNVYLYLTELKKTLPTKMGEPIDEIHVNTAFTSSCSKSTEITLYRIEEWFKVFIHESFHNLGLDFSETFEQNKNARQEILSIFPIKTECRLYETYCEMWAELINIILINVDSKKTFAMSNIERDIQYERKFSLFQTAKILDHYDLNYTELFEKSPEAEKLRKNYQEKTEIFCYFILKTILMYNCNNFIEWVNLNCDGIRFTPDNVEKYVKDLIIPKYNEIKYINTLDKIQTYFDKQQTSFIGTNLRMTALELV